MDDEAIIQLSEGELRKIERVNESFTRREEAEAAREAQQKMRILFERTAQEALPFVVYVAYMGAIGLVVVFKLMDYEGTKLWLGAGLLALVMVAPLAVLPRATFSWLASRSKKFDTAHASALPDPEAISPRE